MPVDRERDRQIRKEVRKVLTRHVIALEGLQLTVVDGRVLLSGEMDKLPMVQPPLKPPFLQLVIDELSVLRGVRVVRCDFSNWVQKGGTWAYVGRDKARRGRR